jgi:hypothetical protein
MHCAESSVWLLIQEFVRFLLHGTGLFLGPLIHLRAFALVGLLVSQLPGPAGTWLLRDSA